MSRWSGDACGNTVEHVQTVDRGEHLVARGPNGLLLGRGCGLEEIPWTPDRPELVADRLRRVGVDLATLAPRS